MPPAGKNRPGPEASAPLRVVLPLLKNRIPRQAAVLIEGEGEPENLPLMVREPEGLAKLVESNQLVDEGNRVDDVHCSLNCSEHANLQRCKDVFSFLSPAGNAQIGCGETLRFHSNPCGTSFALKASGRLRGEL